MQHVKFEVGPFTYNIRRQWALKLDGEPVNAFCSSSLRMIYLDADVPEDVVEATLRHEHAHCWEFETAIPSTVEERATFAATVGAAFDRDWNLFGGLPAVMALPIFGIRPTPKPRIERDRDVPLNTGDRIECGRCGALISCGSIHSSEPRSSDRANIHVVDRGCRCPVCGVVQVWVERVSRDGFPLGEFFSAKLLSGAEAERWLAEHPDLPCRYVDA